MSDRERFDIPVVVFIFKRLDTLEKIFARLAEIRPKKLYLIADQGRDDAERSAAAEVREGVEAFITWDCEVVRDYAKENRGVYGNIALGAKKVFEQEPMAIFLEDDNLPSASFFPFCEEMLNRYKLFAATGTRDLEGYNRLAAEREELHPMPQIVIIIDELADLMIVSQVELVKGEGGAASAVEGLGVAAAHATGEKCERCWKYSATIGSHAAHPTLCARCASVVEA